MPVLNAGEADIYYEIAGRGPPILLIAGTACDGQFWKPWQVPDLARDHMSSLSTSAEPARR